MQKCLTIVVPVYNVEKYITKCLDSLVLDDPELMKQLEVIIVNDGTPDRSAELSREYVKRYPETFRQIDKENGNYGSCINRGLAEARGKYIKILDADDWYDTGEFRRYLEDLRGLDVDMVLNDYRIVNPEGEVTKLCTYQFPESRIFDFLCINDPGIYFSMHSIAYRTEMLREMRYVQTEGISYTDTEWVYYPQMNVRKCVYLKHNVYQYVLGREGQTMDPKVIEKSVGHKIKLTQSLIDFVKNIPEENCCRNAYARIMAFIELITFGLYRFMLVSQSSGSFDKHQFLSFDEVVRMFDASLYERAGRLKLKEYLPIRYVSVWRKTGIRIGGLSVLNLMRKIKNGKL